ncbi:MAG: hypothetical protein IIC84_05670, partial [Chloroflexi bacterium]|nr:hypothetical protein [Chloroflexota bacterium]
IGIMGITLGCGAPAATSIPDSQPAQQPTSLLTPSPATPTAQPTAQVIQDVSVGHKVGDRVPDFELSLDDGTSVTSVSLIEDGKPVFLFFLATW